MVNQLHRYGDWAVKKGACEACESTEGLCLDHDHATGQVRGTLCRKCNWALGLLHDDPARLYALAAYLDRSIDSDPAILLPL